MINTVQLGDCYELIKNIPDNSIDLVYIDIPYLMGKGGGNESELSKRAKKRNTALNDAEITNGIDYSIFDELCRIMKNIYIYMVQSSTIVRYNEILYRKQKMQL